MGVGGSIRWKNEVRKGDVMLEMNGKERKKIKDVAKEVGKTD